MILLYSHSGSFNHGCEALVRSIISLYPNEEFLVQSNTPSEDYAFGIDKLATIVPLGKRFSKRSIFHLTLAKVVKAIFRTDFLYWTGVNKPLKKYMKKISVAFSIGGDNYCYSMNGLLSYQNKFFNKRNIKTILFGASINPESIDSKTIKDLKNYHLITARESLTFDLLKKNNILNVAKTIDTAFFLPISDYRLSFNNYIVINPSPLINKYSQNSDIMLKNYINLINYIIKETDFNIILLPHVCIKGNNDLDSIHEIYSKIKSNRLIILPGSDKLNCCEIKSIIKNSIFTVACRTHASIAAYSSSTPCLVIGYSIKSKGIAKDLFDDYNEYVLDCKKINDSDSILTAFKNLFFKRKEIKMYLDKKISSYKKGLCLYEQKK